MTKQEFSKLAMAMRTYYPREKLLPDDHAMELWYDALNDLDYNTARQAVKKWAETNRWSPSIADIREMCASFIYGEFNSWEEEWDKVRKAVRFYGYMREQEALASLPKMTRTIVERLGFQNLCLSENPAVDRANFRDIYKNMVLKEKQTEQMSVKLRNALEKATEGRYEPSGNKAIEDKGKKEKAEYDENNVVLSERVQELLKKTREGLRSDKDNRRDRSGNPFVGGLRED